MGTNFTLEELREIVAELVKWEDTRFSLNESAEEPDCEQIVRDSPSRALDILADFASGTNPV